MIKRHPQNPILTRNDIPEIKPDLVDVTSVFNPGAVKIGDRYILMLRVQNRGRETFFMIAEGTDGRTFKVADSPVYLLGMESISDTIYHCYDARITAIDDSYYIMFAMDMDDGCRLGLAETGDFASFNFLGITSGRDTRNGVLFPERINGQYLRLERPNTVSLPEGPSTGQTIILSESNDLLNWRTVGPVMQGRFHYWDELIGPGPPPVKTEAGWLLLYHGVAVHLGTVFIYQAGIVLLDLDNPLKVINRRRFNILEPRELYELTGQVPNVIFPSGMIVKETDNKGFAKTESPVFIYYGAADTSVCLATCTIDGLIKLALE